jgi:hypothetical protein
MHLFCLFFTILALPLFSDGVQPLGSGTQADPYQIATLDTSCGEHEPIMLGRLVYSNSVHRRE